MLDNIYFRQINIAILISEGISENDFQILVLEGRQGGTQCW